LHPPSHRRTILIQRTDTLAGDAWQELDDTSCFRLYPSLAASYLRAGQHSLDKEILVERVCFLLKVRQDRLDEYKERHTSVWPEMLHALRETGWHNYSLFLREDGLLVGYFETPDLNGALEGMAQRDINERWQREMAPFFENLGERRPDEGFQRLEEVFHLP
jgi:L-rhamnose mutarotase